MKKRNNDLTAGKVIAIFISAMLLMALGLGAAFLAAYLQDAGTSSKIYTPIGFSLFAFLVAALILLLTNFKKILAYDINRDVQKMDAQELLILQGASERKITEACVQHKFVIRDGDYFHKRKYSVSKDYINYFVRITPATDIAMEFRMGQQFSSLGKANDSLDGHKRIQLLYLF
ncbi:MAG: hypothetical protein IJX76_07365 [Clostridia bacterium]|nr:hypothetical protein [Clostridia bacterium]